jgi:hypothetical protein
MPRASLTRRIPDPSTRQQARLAEDHHLLEKAAACLADRNRLDTWVHTAISGHTTLTLEHGLGTDTTPDRTQHPQHQHPRPLPATRPHAELTLGTAIPRARRTAEQTP